MVLLAVGTSPVHSVVAGSMMIHSHPPCIDCSDTS
ncbi:hypothetical protein TGARI_276820, partial [Toxoplasma gondii ARI]